MRTAIYVLSTVGFFTLRHFQNAALLMGLFLCVAGIVVMLGDLLAHGEARVSLDHLSDGDESEDDPEVKAPNDGPSNGSGTLNTRHDWWNPEHSRRDAESGAGGTGR